MEHNYSISSYTYNDVYNQGSINVPFSWEHKPGLSKVTHHQLSSNVTRHAKLVVHPPPCSSFGTGSDRIRVEVDTQIPLGLCAVQPSLRISSFRMESTQKEEDPFLEAYKKYTKSPFMLQSSNRGKKNNGSWPSIRKYMHILSCKYSVSGDACSRKAVYSYKM